MPKKTTPQSEAISQIEEAQAQLRQNIEASKALVEKTQKLLKKAKQADDE